MSRSGLTVVENHWGWTPLGIYRWMRWGWAWPYARWWINDWVRVETRHKIGPFCWSGGFRPYQQGEFQ